MSNVGRLARKNIGPRMIGTFQNGRFEQYLHAETLTRDDIRNPVTSRHIAKRMRELHEGIDLEDSEIRNGPTVWINWDKWVGRAREVMKTVETQEEKQCVVVWKAFEDAVGRYKRWLVGRCEGEEGLKKDLVFAHNDVIHQINSRFNLPVQLTCRGINRPSMGISFE